MSTRFRGFTQDSDWEVLPNHPMMNTIWRNSDSIIQSSLDYANGDVNDEEYLSSLSRVFIVIDVARHKKNGCIFLSAQKANQNYDGTYSVPGFGTLTRSQIFADTSEMDMTRTFAIDDETYTIIEQDNIDPVIAEHLTSLDS